MSTIQSVSSSIGVASKFGMDLVEKGYEFVKENIEEGKIGVATKFGMDLASDLFSEEGNAMLEILQNDELGLSEKVSQIAGMKSAPLKNSLEFGFDLGQKAANWFKGLFSQTE